MGKSSIARFYAAARWLHMSRRRGSCAASVQTAAEAHFLNDDGAEPLGVRDELIERDVLGEVVLVHASKHPQVGPQRRVRAFAAVAVHLTESVPVFVSGPLAPPVLATAVAHARMQHRELV